MGFLEALILGIIQGLTEFLPVSSSGHLELGKAVLGSVPEEGLLMTVVLHFATALSTVVIFRKDIGEIFKGLFQFKNNAESRFALCVVLSMIPAAIVGVFLEDEIDTFFSGNVFVVGLMLFATGGLLFLADKAKDTGEEISTSKAITIGIAQAIAILPGISRSGATIGTSVLLGIDRTKAARFSFLMVIPLILGAMLVKTKKFIDVSSLESMVVEERADHMISKMEEDFDFSEVDLNELHFAITQKEDTWYSLSQMEENDTALKRKMELEYVSSLSNSGISDEMIPDVLEHDEGQIRSSRRTSSMALIVGFLAAFLTGIFACQWMIRIVKNSKLKYFSYYCFVVGALAVIFSVV